MKDLQRLAEYYKVPVQQMAVSYFAFYFQFFQLAYSTFPELIYVKLGWKIFSDYNTNQFKAGKKQRKVIVIIPVIYLHKI